MTAGLDEDDKVSALGTQSKLTALLASETASRERSTEN